jgi:DNA-binding protein HU-beta
VSRWADYTGGTIVVLERKGSALGVPRGGAAIEGRPPRRSLRRRSPIEDRAAIRRSDLLETTMNNAELAETLVANHNLSKADARKVVDDVMAAIVAAAVKGDEVSLSGFGKFKVKDSPAREGRNPANGETIQIAASKKLTFVPAKAVKDALNG